MPVAQRVKTLPGDKNDDTFVCKALGKRCSDVLRVCLWILWDRNGWQYHAAKHGMRWISFIGEGHERNACIAFRNE